jgi:hypothetical protein
VADALKVSHDTESRIKKIHEKAAIGTDPVAAFFL